MCTRTRQYDQSQILPKSDFAGVVRYTHGNWAALTSYASTGFVPIDNNAIERLMKQVALGRKNWLIVENVAAGERRAMLMSGSIAEIFVVSIFGILD